MEAKSILENPKAEDSVTIVGTFDGNVITMQEGEKFPCCAYSIVREKIEKKFGAFNLKFNGDIKEWIVFQYILL